MNKIKIVAVILFLITMLAHAERLAVLKENYSSPFMVFDKEYIYVGDRRTLFINIYSRKDFSFIKTFGGEGEGPAQFMWIHSIQVDREFVYVSGSAKFSIFSKPGKLIKEIRMNPNSGKYMKLGQNFVSSSDLDSENNRDIYRKINLIGDTGEKTKELCTVKISPIWSYNTPKQDFLLVSDCVEYAVNNQELYLGNTIKGFYFIVFGENGDKISEINLPYEKRPIKADEKEEYISRFAHWHGEARKKRLNFLFPEFYPAFETFSIADDRIYAFLFNPHPMTIKEQQIVILDLQGKLLKQIAAPLPLDAAFSISDGKFYYLTDNEDTEMWELHAIKIDI